MSETSRNAGEVSETACNGFEVLTSDDVRYLRYTESILEDYGITGMPVIKRIRKQYVPGFLSPSPREPGHKANVDHIVLVIRPAICLY